MSVLIIQYIRSCPPKLEGVSFIRNLRTRHAAVTRDPPNMAPFLLLFSYFPFLRHYFSFSFFPFYFLCFVSLFFHSFRIFVYYDCLFFIFGALFLFPLLVSFIATFSLLFRLHFPFFSSFCLRFSQMRLTLSSKQREVTFSDRSSGMIQFEQRFESTAAAGLLAGRQQPPY
jgi:hypothetical protein